MMFIAINRSHNVEILFIIIIVAVVVVVVIIINVLTLRRLLKRLSNIIRPLLLVIMAFFTISSLCTGQCKI